MRFFKIATVLSVCLGFAHVGFAQEREGVWVTYYVKPDTNVVTGLMQVALKTDGDPVVARYSLKRISDFIAEDCASGKVGKIVLGKQKTKRRWKFMRQSFETTCEGGPHPNIGSTNTVEVQIKRQADGRDLAEYFFSRNGDAIKDFNYR